MATGSANSFRPRGSFEGCISGHDSNFSHRPYHKNCRCALHDKSRRSGLPPIARCNSVSYPVRRSRSESSLSLAAAAAAASASPLHSSPSASFMLFEICDYEDDDDAGLN